MCTQICYIFNYEYIVHLLFLTIHHAEFFILGVHKCIAYLDICNTLQYSTLQHTATHCNTLQHTATHCNTLQHTATHCSALQHAASPFNTLMRVYIYVYWCVYIYVYWYHCMPTVCCQWQQYSIIDIIVRGGNMRYFFVRKCVRVGHVFVTRLRVRSHCKTARCTATHCNTLQHTATHRSVLRCIVVYVWVGRVNICSHTHTHKYTPTHMHTRSAFKVDLLVTIFGRTMQTCAHTHIYTHAH